MPEVPQQLFVLRTERVQGVGSHDSRKLFLQVVWHLSLTSLPALRFLPPSSDVSTHVPTLGQHHGVAVLIQ